MPELPAEPAGEDLPALVAGLCTANARLREVIEDKDVQLAATGAALEAAQAGFAELSERVAELERRLGKDSPASPGPPSSDSPYTKKPRDRSVPLFTQWCKTIPKRVNRFGIVFAPD